MSRFSSPVRFSSTAAYCPDTPIIRRMRSGSRPTSMPSMVAVPDSGRMRVVSTFTAVDLPAPFGPSRPRTVPVGTARLSPSSAFTTGDRRGR